MLVLTRVEHIITVLMIRIENCLDTGFSNRNSQVFPLIMYRKSD